MAESYRPKGPQDLNEKLDRGRPGIGEVTDTAIPPMARPQALRPVVPPRESYFLRADPMRGLRIFEQELERLAVLEPRIQDATERIEERLASLPSEEAEVLVPLLWVQVREQYGDHVSLTIICNWLADAGWTVRIMDDA